MEVKIEAGSKVLVPRTGGGYSKGNVLVVADGMAVVSFPIGKTYRGEAHTYNEEETATKKVAISELLPV